MTATASTTQATTSPDAQLLIAGQWTDAENGRTTVVSSPLGKEYETQVAAASVGDAIRAVEAARDAARTWGTWSPARRREVLQAAAGLIRERADEISAVMTQEMGATAAWAGFNAHVAEGMLAEAAAQTYSTVGEVIPSDVPGLTALGVRQPAGVVLGIAPWNAPLILGVRAVAMPLAFGNTVVLKASEQAPLTQAAIVAALHDAGLPAGAVNLITNAPEDAADIVAGVIAHPAVTRVNFTGSTRVGRIIAEQAGRHLTRVLLELGGKAPLLVLADADLDAAVDAACFGAFMNQGQICMSTERIIVDRSIAEEFSNRLAERAAALVVGDPRDPKTQIGPLVNEAGVKQVKALVEDAVAAGAQRLAGGDPDGLYFPPTVLRGITPAMRIYAEESFGPVASIVEVDGTEEAIAVANDTEYGLSAAVFSSDAAGALQIAQRIHSGSCHVNGATVHDEPQMPFGGVGASGWGRFGSRASLEEFTELRWLTVQSGARHYPI
ncbi:aldehyde dehydrogenase [Streptomyces justiciae]|uniref:aldehyde dehydrogenase n=1 Tax=Streptomyces justiciae TaxID=2780140 RepID=UPI002117CA6F|nr:aldehyde dehydrogenase [Streptomyces justiciae]MCW8378648.1 aldehyde dehydrogenase [Streptomyces justiciae]